nr:aldo/keto reductase [Saccharothrix deserti]
MASPAPQWFAERAPLGRSDVTVTRLGLGTAPLAGLFTEVAEDQAAATLEAAWAAGVRYFDTAPHYGAGLAERRLGTFLAGRPGAEFAVSTKVGRLLLPGEPPPGSEGFFYDDPGVVRVRDYSAEGVYRSLAESLERSGLDSFEIVLIHDPDHHWKEAVTGAYPAPARLRAGDETGVHTPLRDTGMTKADVRAVSRLWNLPTWDKPATPCLASRVRYGLTITPARLARVQRAEAAVRTWLTDTGTPTHDLRVRDLGDTGRIELDPHLAHRPEIGPALTEIVRAAGFDNAELAVFRSGNLNHEPTRRTGGQVQRAADPGEQVVFPGSPAGRRRGVRCGRGGSGSRRGRCPSDSPCGVRTGRSAADRRTGTRGCHRNRWRVECAVVARRRSRVRSPVGCGRGAGRRPTVGRVAFDHAAAAPAVGGGGVVVVDPLPVPDLPAGSAAGQTLGEQPPHDRCRLGVGLGTATPRAATGLSGVEEHLHNAPSPAITSEATSTCHAFEVSGSWCSMVEVRPGTSDQRVQSSGNACVSRR